MSMVKYSTEACPECPQAFLELDHDGTGSVWHCPNCGHLQPVRYCSICHAETTGAPLCARCARHLRRECKLVHEAITAGACVGSGTIRNLRRDEERLAEYDEWVIGLRLRALEQVAEAAAQVVLFGPPIVDMDSVDVEALLAALGDLATLDRKREEAEAHDAQPE